MMMIAATKASSTKALHTAEVHSRLLQEFAYNSVAVPSLTTQFLTTFPFLPKLVLISVESGLPASFDLDYLCDLPNYPILLGARGQYWRVDFNSTPAQLLQPAALEARRNNV
jgi:hypothetical protein